MNVIQSRFENYNPVTCSQHYTHWQDAENHFSIRYSISESNSEAHQPFASKHVYTRKLHGWEL
jgi:hypothetical protein